MSENQPMGGRKQRVTNELIEDGTRDLLSGKSLEEIEEDISAKAKALNLDEAEIVRKIRNETGDVFAELPRDDKNISISSLKVQQAFDEAINRIAGNEDPEKVILETEDTLEKYGINEKQRDDIIQKILSTFELPEKEKNVDEILLQESGEAIKLPKLDVDYDDLKELKLKKDKEGILPDKNRKFMTERDFELGKEFKNIKESLGKEQMEIRDNADKRLNEKGDLVVETQKLSDYIRQTRICVVTTPLSVRKIDLETILYRYLSSEDQGRFTRIFIFGWEDQTNTEDYKSFEQLLEINSGIEGALMIIRDIKTFNIFAADVLKGVPKNYFLILIDGLITKEDLVVVENVSNDPSFLYPDFTDFRINLPQSKDISVITEDDHMYYYKNELAKYYSKPEIGLKEIYSNMSDQEGVINIGRKILNVNLQGIQSLANPGVTLNECLKRSPKFRSVMTKILANSGSRILVKMIPGPYGLESFSYMYSLLKKKPIKPVVINSTENFESKRLKIQGLPEKGPCLVMTDFILVDTLIPKNVDMIFIVGGGEFTDFQTIIDSMKAVNYTIDKYPRNIEITNFITTLNNEVTETIDVLDYKKFKNNFDRLESNTSKIKSASLPIVIKERTLIVRLDED